MGWWAYAKRLEIQTVVPALPPRSFPLPLQALSELLCHSYDTSCKSHPRPCPLCPPSKPPSNPPGSNLEPW
eukprot:9474186-Pyramimonas_sp.AAC.1